MKTEATPSSVKQRGKFEIILSKIGSWISRPENLVLLILAVLLSFFVLYPLWSIIQNSLTVHPGKEYNFALATGYNTKGLSVSNWANLLTGDYGKNYLWYR